MKTILSFNFDEYRDAVKQLFICESKIIWIEIKMMKQIEQFLWKWSVINFIAEHYSNMPLFGKSSKSPAEVVKNLKDSLTNLEKFGGDTIGGKKVEKAQDDVSKYLFSISSLLFNSCDTDQQSDIILAQLSQVRCSPDYDEEWRFS